MRNGTVYKNVFVCYGMAGAIFKVRAKVKRKQIILKR